MRRVAVVAARVVLGGMVYVGGVMVASALMAGLLLRDATYDPTRARVVR